MAAAPSAVMSLRAQCIWTMREPSRSVVPIVPTTYREIKCRSDARALAKAKRLERFMETGRHRNRKSRPIQSRGFDKSLRKRMDGTVERRRA